ncbi:MAG: DUF86 domain-containing protein [Deltaproteobacteria bacterium]|nr:DUF86 domain-containing protein [Deltaproteobacteria bacterium]
MSRDESYLLDILLAARQVLSFIEGMDFGRFGGSKLHQDAVVRELEVIGEAAKKISDQTKAKIPAVPWSKVSGMRDRLIHEYFRVDLDQVWDTARKDLPELIAQIEPLVPPEKES